jgi:fermentation-respiration switch protein FrsA (DUF1100 family)
MILENTFTSISEMVDYIFPSLKYFKRIILRMHWPSIDRIPKVRVPIMFICGSQDEIVPSFHAKKLHDAAVSAPFKQMLVVQGGMHNDTWLKGGKDYIYALKDFIDKAQEHRQSMNSGANNNQTSGRQSLSNTLQQQQQT